MGQSTWGILTQHSNREQLHTDQKKINLVNFFEIHRNQTNPTTWQRRELKPSLSKLKSLN